MMDKKQQTNHVLLSGIAISAILVASLLINNSQFVHKALAQGIAAPNATNKAGSMMTGNKTANQTGAVTSGQSDLNAVLNAVRNTNATSTATKNIINATTGNMTNKSG
ncbi:MAG TPA: hypothetical protein VI278_06715 [Nitrososphaeraceae archaeon]